MERLEKFFEANDIDEGKQMPTLLRVMGASTYGLLRNLVRPLKPKDNSNDDIFAILKTRFKPKPLLIAERFCFNRCNQRADESVTDYTVELKQCAANCDFEATLDEAVCDRFVSGICNEVCQQQLLSEASLTFARTFELTLSMETEERDAAAPLIQCAPRAVAHSRHTGGKPDEEEVLPMWKVPYLWKNWPYQENLQRESGCCPDTKEK